MASVGISADEDPDDWLPLSPSLGTTVMESSTTTTIFPPPDPLFSLSELLLSPPDPPFDVLLPPFSSSGLLLPPPWIALAISPSCASVRLVTPVTELTHVAV